MEKLFAVNSCVVLNGTVAEVVVTVAAADGVGVGVGVGAGVLDPPQPITHINIAQPSRTPKNLDITPNPFYRSLLRADIPPAVKGFYPYFVRFIQS